MTTKRDQANILDAAADLIEAENWYHPGIAAYTRGHCAAMALGTVIGRDEGWSSIYEPIRDALCIFVGFEPPLIATWNDSFDNPQAVLDGMRGCAKELRIQADLEDVGA